MIRFGVLSFVHQNQVQNIILSLSEKHYEYREMLDFRVHLGIVKIQVYSLIVSQHSKVEIYLHVRFLMELWKTFEFMIVRVHLGIRAYILQEFLCMEHRKYNHPERLLHPKQQFDQIHHPQYSDILEMMETNSLIQHSSKQSASLLIERS